MLKNANELNGSEHFTHKVCTFGALFVREMFKKAIHITFLFLFVLSTSGVSVASHYCGGTLMEVDVASMADACCDDEGCCKTEIQLYQLQDDFSAPVFELDFTQFAIQLPIALVLMDMALPTQTHPLFWVANDPPPPDIHTTLSLFQQYIL